MDSNEGDDDLSVPINAVGASHLLFPAGFDERFSQMALCSISGRVHSLASIQMHRTYAIAHMEKAFAVQIKPA